MAGLYEGGRRFTVVDFRMKMKSILTSYNLPEIMEGIKFYKRVEQARD